MSQAFPFVTVNDSGEFKVHPEAEEYLRSLPSDIKCVAPVCIAGKSRTGKSFLLNALSGASLEGGGGQGGGGGAVAPAAV
jgi:GTP-binding protein EngB required for normal cell division